MKQKFTFLLALLCMISMGALADDVEIASLADLQSFRDAVNSGTNYKGQTVKLTADIDMSSVSNWTPIGNVDSYPSTTFYGTFDGQGHIISNLTSSVTGENATAGLFGSLCGVVENLTVKNVNISSTHYAGGICGYSSSNVGMEIKNCHVIGGTISSTPILVGDSYDNGDKVGGIIGYCVTGDKVTDCSVEDVTISAYRDLGGICGCAAGTISGCSVKNSSIIQDPTNGYKSSVTTYAEIIGRDMGATLSNNTSDNVTVKSNAVATVETSSTETTVTVNNVAETTSVVAAELPANAFSTEATAPVTVKPDNSTNSLFASITFDADATKAIATNSSSSAVSFKIEDVTASSSMTDAVETATKDATKVIEISMVKSSDANAEVFSSDNAKGTATITIPYTKQDASKSVKVYFVASDGTKTELTNVSYSDGKLSFTVQHFSTYAIEEGAEIPSNVVAKIGNTGYETLAEAVAAAPTDGTETTITLLKSTEGTGVKIAEGKNIVFDLAGYTYTITSGTVGSTGTETNAFQLLKGSTITFKNGGLESTVAKILLQNYCNLTLDNVKVNTKKAAQMNYAVSNNFGSLTTKNGTEIYASAGKVAFDCWYGMYSVYDEGITINIASDTKIEGPVEYGAASRITGTDWTEKAAVKFAEGTDLSNVTFKASSSQAVTPNIKVGDNAVVVAKAGTTYYSTLSAALAAVQNGQTVTLLTDIDDASNYLLINNGKTFTLDLNGKTLKQDGVYLYSGFVTVKNGTLTSSVYQFTSKTDAAYNSLTLAKDATIDANTGYGIIVYQNSVGANNFGSTLNVNGTIKNAVAGIWVMGNITTDLATAANPVKINVSGTITADQDESVGIAESGAAVLTIADGASISGSTAVEVRAGSINVTGGTLTGTATPTSVTPNGNGTTTDGAALAVAQHTTMQPISANITGGTLNGYSAFYESNPNDNADDAIAQVSIAISGGTFNATNGGTVSVYSEDETGFVSGGSFSSAVSTDYCALGYQSATTADPTTGKFSVTPITYALTAYAGSETSQSITTIAAWNALLAQNPNAIATAEDNETNEALANGSKNIVLLSNSSNVCPNFVLTDPATNTIGAAANFYTPVAFTATAGSYTRSLRANGNAICVPFALSGTDEFKLQSFKEKGSDVVYFEETASVEAGVPCILYSPEAQTYTWEFENTSIVASPSNGSSMEGTFTATGAYNGNTNYYGMLDNGQEFGLAPVTLYPFRSILNLSGENAKARRIVFLGIDDDETAINSISSDASAKKDIYTINGVKVSEVKQPGLYIINGKKTFVK